MEYGQLIHFSCGLTELMRYIYLSYLSLVLQVNVEVKDHWQVESQNHHYPLHQEHLERWPGTTKTSCL